MPIITLTTDFGTKDFYTGALKGAILKACDRVDIIDLTHDIEPFNITEAAFVLRNAYPNFPEGTVHIVNVNDQDNRESRCVIIEQEGQYFIGFDNGIFSLVFNEDPDQIVEYLDFPQNGSLSTFPGKDVFAKIAGQIIEGKSIEQIGRKIHDINRRTSLLPIVQDALIRGTVIYVDSFHNVILNVTKELFEEIGQNRNFVVSFKRNERINEISGNYFDVPQGEKLCLFNSAGYMEIAINSGKASSLLGLNIGDIVQIDFE